MRSTHRTDKYRLAREGKQTFDRFMADFNAGAAERRAAEESEAEEFAEKYLSAMRRKLGLKERAEKDGD